MSDDHDETAKAFCEAVNMGPAEIERWLETEKSRAVGAKGEDGGESVGHSEGRRIVGIRRKKKGDLTDEDYAHMKKIVGYVHRHLKQRPKGDISDTKWRYSLRNWGHDPEKA